MGTALLAAALGEPPRGQRQSLPKRGAQGDRGGARRPCTVTQGTAIPIGFGSAWSNAEDPFPQDEAAQRAVALAADQGLAQIQVTVDGDDPVHTHRPRFEIFSPQRTVQLPAENILGVPAQTVTLTAHAWSVLVRNLRPGHHTILAEVVWDGEPFSVTYVIDVVPRHDR
jgi:hypothetical protein